jgi:hypothetical protein
VRYVRGLVLLAMLSGHTDGGQRHSDNLSGHPCPSRKRTTFSRNMRSVVERSVGIASAVDHQDGRRQNLNSLRAHGLRKTGYDWRGHLGHPLTYYNPPSDVESDCIGEVQAPSNVEEDHMRAAYGGTNLVGSKF